MARTITANAREQVQFTEMADVLLVVLDITHADLTGTLRLVNNNQSITYNSNTYSASNFKFIPPAQEGGEVVSAKLSFSNVDRTLLAALRSIPTAPEITVNIIFYGTSAVREAGPWVFYLKDILYDVKTITGTLAYKFNPKQKASTIIMNYADFPSELPVI